MPAQTPNDKERRSGPRPAMPDIERPMSMMEQIKSLRSQEKPKAEMAEDVNKTASLTKEKMAKLMRKPETDGT